MKRTLIFSFFLMSWSISFCQTAANPNLYNSITLDHTYINPITKSAVQKSYPLGISDKQTIHIIFPADVAEIDIGIPNIFVEITPSFKNVIKIKTTPEPNQPVSNLTILTTDGKLYSFLTSYQEYPEILNINISDIEYFKNVKSAESKATFSIENKTEKTKKNKRDKPAIPETKTEEFEDFIQTTTISDKKVITTTPKEIPIKENTFLLPGLQMSENDIRSKMSKILRSKNQFRNIGVTNQEVNLYLNGIYTDHSVLYFSLIIENPTNIPYQIDFEKIYIKDQEVLKRMAAQEEEIDVLFNSNELISVPPKSRFMFVSTIKLRTISSGKFFEIEIYEKNGGRHLNLPIQSQIINKARYIKY